MLVVRITRWVRITAVAVFAFLVCLILSKEIGDYRRGIERARLVASIVEAQATDLYRPKLSSSFPDQATGLPDDSIALQSWLISESMRTRDPGAVAVALNQLSNRT